MGWILCDIWWVKFIQTVLHLCSTANVIICTDPDTPKPNQLFEWVEHKLQPVANFFTYALQNSSEIVIEAKIALGTLRY